MCHRSWVRTQTCSVVNFQNLSTSISTSASPAVEIHFQMPRFLIQKFQRRRVPLDLFMNNISTPQLFLHLFIRIRIYPLNRIRTTVEIHLQTSRPLDENDAVVLAGVRPLLRIAARCLLLLSIVVVLLPGLRC